MKCIYISGPYTALTNVERQRNINRAWELATRVWGIPGAYAVCPHTNTMHMDGAAGWEDYNKFITADLDLVKRVDALLMMDRWKESRGAIKEHDYAVLTCKPVFYGEIGGLEALAAWVASASRLKGESP